MNPIFTPLYLKIENKKFIILGLITFIERYQTSAKMLFFLIFK